MAKSVESHRDWDEPSPKLHQGMREFMEEVSEPVPSEFDMNTSGIWTLLHWKRLLSLVSLLKPGDQIHFKDLFELSPEEKEQLPHIPSAFDSHCHLDRCMNKLGITSHFLADINSTVTVREEYQVDVQHAVGVFSDPETYPTRDQVHEWKSQGVVVAVGLHPRKTNPSAEQWQRFEELLSWPEITALGEVGIDRMEPVNTWSSQMLNLDRALQSLRPDQVLILHGRSSDDDPDEAWLTCLFKACPRVTREHLIHCHCFMGSKRLVQRWTSEFPNTYFGFTSIVSRFRNNKDTAKLDCIKWLSEHRLLLETDAPYFPKGGHRRSVPALLGYSADEVAKIRGVTWQDLLKKTNSNATRLYLDGAAPATETT
ncbi:3'-5' ssDNA/RNA exonuclease TatD-like [Mercenaria mercenaria]|uniref:3'-5' ssDNA/RNA exonuclease TatD-like n=1 Tax=Mercenaria mercenaria TaxID=6596 RepID=UPI00234E8EC2|nr:3'-5' ssDNA/RNA exonuclease TatD-like [Mercenaria mercenaria]